MEHYGIWSVIPPLVAIVLAIRTKKVFIALFGGIWMSFLVLDDWHPILSFYDSVMALVKVFQSEGNTKTIMFSALVGALILFVQKSGGVEGFVRLMQNKFRFTENTDSRLLRKKVGFMAWLTGIIVFVETSISSLTVGTVFRPLFDKLKISREKLAYLADSSSAPVSVLLPFNAWGAFIMGLLLTEGLNNVFWQMIKSIPYNFYAWVTLLVGFLTVLFDWNIGPMKRAEKRVKEKGLLLNPGAVPMVSEALTEVKPTGNARFKAYNMLVPIGTMVLMMPVLLTVTGWNRGIEIQTGKAWFQKILTAMGNGSGSTSVLFAVITALIVAAMLYRIQGIADFHKMNDWTLKGISEMMPLALLMMMAFAIGGVTKELGTGVYLAGLAKEFLSPAWVPAVVFVLSAFIAFSTGTSWGTFAIMIPIAIPIALKLGLPVSLVLAAVLSGGVFGDHASPISDTTIISSMAAATDHIDHVKTQLPYALLSAFVAGLLFLIAGFVSV
jgi:Na+/H+ antiporter NhaC